MEYRAHLTTSEAVVIHHTARVDSLLDHGAILCVALDDHNSASCLIATIVCQRVYLIPALCVLAQLCETSTVPS